MDSALPNLAVLSSNIYLTSFILIVSTQVKKVLECNCQDLEGLMLVYLFKSAIHMFLYTLGELC